MASRLVACCSLLVAAIISSATRGYYLILSSVGCSHSCIPPTATRIERKALNVLAALAKHSPSSFTSKDLPKIITALMTKVSMKGDATYSAMVTNALYWIQKGCTDLSKLSVPRAHINNMAQYTADRSLEAEEESELEEEQALYDYENV